MHRCQYIILAASSVNSTVLLPTGEKNRTWYVDVSRACTLAVPRTYATPTLRWSTCMLPNTRLHVCASLSLSLSLWALAVGVSCCHARARASRSIRCPVPEVVRTHRRFSRWIPRRPRKKGGRASGRRRDGGSARDRRPARPIGTSAAAGERSLLSCGYRSVPPLLIRRACMCVVRSRRRPAGHGRINRPSLVDRSSLSCVYRAPPGVAATPTAKGAN
jgi:hypothetical protein